MGKPKDIRQQIIDLANEIDSDVDHGECFYEEDMFKEFIANLDKMKKLAKQYYKQNQKEMEED
jgi:hypothetical protein